MLTGMVILTEILQITTVMVMKRQSMAESIWKNDNNFDDNSVVQFSIEMMLVQVVYVIRVPNRLFMQVVENAGKCRCPFNKPFGWNPCI